MNLKCNTEGYRWRTTDLLQILPKKVMQYVSVFRNVILGYNSCDTSVSGAEWMQEEQTYLTRVSTNLK